MAQTLIWSHEALDDIDRIAEYISRDSRYHAQQVVERLFDLDLTLRYAAQGTLHVQSTLDALPRFP